MHNWLIWSEYQDESDAVGFAACDEWSFEHEVRDFCQKDYEKDPWETDTKEFFVKSVNSGEVKKFEGHRNIRVYISCCEIK